MILYKNRTLHLADFVAKHPLDFVTHGFLTGRTKMDTHFIGGFAFLHECGVTVLLQRWKHHTACGADIGDLFLFIAHITPPQRKALNPQNERLTTYHGLFSLPVWNGSVAFYSSGLKTLFAAINTFPVKRIRSCGFIGLGKTAIPACASCSFPHENLSFRRRG
jgi:hypothetical protein